MNFRGAMPVRILLERKAKTDGRGTLKLKFTFRISI